MSKFETLGLSAVILKTIAEMGYDEPTPIQKAAIPHVLEGKDLMGLAQTGTGKTAAFGLPLIHHLNKNNAKVEPKKVRALILAPTRELAGQISDNLRSFAKLTPLRIGMVVGGVSAKPQIKSLARGMDILVATPGRLLDLVERKALFLDSATFLVLDEADQMLDLGFIHALRQIARLLGRPRQTLLFSATMPKLVEELSRTYLDDPVRIEMAPSGRAADKVRQSVHFINQGGKTELLKDCLIQRRDDLSLVFARTKRSAEKLMKHLVDCGFKAASIHGNKSQGQRDRALRGFKSGDIRILVATDVAARGIDINGVSHVYVYDLPEVPENYIHRIGRTARAGAGGEAVTFCSAEEVHLLKDIERLMDMSIPVASGERPAAMSKKSRKGKTQSRERNRKAQGQGNRGKQNRSERQANNNKGERDANASQQPKRNKKRREGQRSEGQRSEGQRTEATANSRPGKWRSRPKRKTVAA